MISPRKSPSPLSVSQAVVNGNKFRTNDDDLYKSFENEIKNPPIVDKGTFIFDDNDSFQKSIRKNKKRLEKSLLDPFMREFFERDSK